MKRLVLIGVALLLAVGVVTPLSALGAGAGRVAGQTASLKMVDFKFISSQFVSAEFGKASILKAGPTKITFTNVGKFGHDFTIVQTSKGATKFSSGMVKAGTSKTITVNLKPGAYIAACLQFNGGHFSEGMVRPFTVGRQNANTGNWGP